MSASKVIFVVHNIEALLTLKISNFRPKKSKKLSVEINIVNYKNNFLDTLVFKTIRAEKKKFLLVKMVAGISLVLNKQRTQGKKNYSDKAPQGVLTMSRIQKYQF